MRKRAEFTILLLLLFTSLILSAKNIIVVTGDESFPPFEFVNEKGNFVGYNVDVINAIATKLNWEVIFKPMAWADAKKALREGRVDAIEGMAYSQERAKIYDFSNPTLVSFHGIFVKTDVVGVNSITDLKGYQVAVQKGDIMEEYLKNKNIVLVEVPDQKMALMKLQRNEVIAFVGNNWLFSYLLRNLKIKDIKRVGEPLYPTDYCIAVQKGNTVLITQINEAIDLLKKEGIIEKLQKKWFEQIKDKQKDLVWLPWIVVVLLAILCLYLFLNGIKIKHRIREELEKTKKQTLLEKINCEKLRSIFDLSQFTRKSFSENEIFTKALEIALKVVPSADAGSIIMKDEDGKYSYKKFKGYGDSLKKVKFTERQLLGIRDKVIILQNLEQMDSELLTPGQFELIDQADGFRMSSLIIAPIKSKREFFGQISLDSKEKFAFKEKDRYILSLVASVVANFIEHSNLRKEIENVKRDEILLKERFEHIRENLEQISEKMLLEVKDLGKSIASIQNIRCESEKAERDLRRILSVLFLESEFVKDICLLEYRDNGWHVSFNSSITGYIDEFSNIPKSVDIEMMKGLIEKGIKEVSPMLYSNILVQLLPLSKTVVRISLKESDKTIYMEILEPLLLFSDSILRDANFVSLRKKQDITGLKNVSYLIDIVDGYPEGNSELVADYAVRLAQKMGLDEESINTLYFASFTRDIGKLLIDEKILRKSSKLTDTEYDQIKLHPVYGEKIVETIYPDAAKIIRHHHERYDGSGYPDGFKGNKIPLESRILFAVLSYFAMKNDRPYRKALTKKECIRELYKGRGKEWDTKVVDVFLNEIVRDED